MRPSMASATQHAGLVTCLGGAFGYSLLGARARDAAKSKAA